MDQNEREYQEFVLKVYAKIDELKEDYNKLSTENKERFDKEVGHPKVIELVKNEWNGKRGI